MRVRRQASTSSDADDRRTRTSGAGYESLIIASYAFFFNINFAVYGAECSGVE